MCPLNGLTRLGNCRLGVCIALRVFISLQEYGKRFKAIAIVTKLSEPHNFQNLMTFIFINTSAQLNPPSYWNRWRTASPESKPGWPATDCALIPPKRKSFGSDLLVVWRNALPTLAIQASTREMQFAICSNSSED